jgi:tyrosyl-tRNA synthetase
VLATEATALLHGRDAALQAEKSAKVTFEQGGFGTDLPRLAVRVGDSLAAANTKIGFSSSNSEARKLILSGAVSLGDRKITDPQYKFSTDDFATGQTLLSTGKRRKGILTPESE